MEVTLKRLKENGAYAGEELCLTQLKSYSFGQMASNDFILIAPTVENNHCIFHNQLNGLFAEVVKSLPGVLIVNGKKYLSGSLVRLNNNDIVNIGLFLQYKVKMKTASLIAYNCDFDDVKIENDEEDGFPYQKVNVSKVDNLRNEGATLNTETFKWEILHKVKQESSNEIESGSSLQEIDTAMQIEIGKQENKFENPFSFDSSAVIKTESYHSSSESKSHEFATKAASDSSFENLSDSSSEKEHLSHSLPDEVHLPDSSTDNKLLNFSSKEINFKCSLCAKYFGRKGNLQEHMLTHSTEKKFKCSLCVRGFVRKSNLKRHMLTHSIEKKFRCSLCEKGYRYKELLKQHMLSHSTEEMFKCSFCEKDFGRKQCLKLHMLIHSTEKKYKCSLCEKDFIRKDYLHHHLLMIHSTERNFKCFLCEKDFGCKKYLEQHMMSHSMEKKVKCSLCEKSFKCQQHLQVHMQIHTTEKKFKCSLCEKDFKKKYRLQRHMLIHSRKKI